MFKLAMFFDTLSELTGFRFGLVCFMTVLLGINLVADIFRIGRIVLVEHRKVTSYIAFCIIPIAVGFVTFWLISLPVPATTFMKGLYWIGVPILVLDCFSVNALLAFIKFDR